MNNANLELYDTFGHCVYSPIFNSSPSITMLDLRSGLYYLRLTDHDTGKIESKTIIE